MNANRMLGISTVIKGKSSEKLSSGYKINRAADDAAGLQISEKMRSQIRGLTQASDNTQDGVSFCQIADGALEEVQAMMKRCTELSIQAANGTNTDADREAIQKEVDQITKEIDRVHESALFNELRVFPDAGLNPDDAAVTAVKYPAGNTVREVVVGNTVVSLEFIGNTREAEAVQGTPEASGTANPDSVKNSEMAQFVVDAAANAVSKLQSKYSNLFAEASSSNIQIGLEMSPKDHGNAAATAAISLRTNSTGSVTSYRLWVDTLDYPIDSFPTMSAEKMADLAAVIAHEMTHIMMDDTLTNGMLKVFPKWFKEGMAQASSGDNNWVSNELGPRSTAEKINTFKAKLMNNEYGAGYLAAMYLGQKASGESTVSSENIAKGLDKLLTEMAKEVKAKGPGDATAYETALKTVTGFNSFAEFQNTFMSAGDTASTQFISSLLQARGTTGAGSILGSLGTSEASLFGTLSGSADTYKVNKDNQWYSSMFGSGIDIPKNLPSAGGGGSGLGNDRDGFIIQAGAANKEEQQIFVKQFNISTGSLFEGQTMDCSTIEGARESIAIAQNADAKVSAVRSYYGAMQNRLEHTISNLDNIVENTTAAESQIRDTDMAKEMVNYTKTNVLIQAGNAMLSQAMQTPQNVLQLLS